MLRGRIRKYIYISTDSVYEVSKEKKQHAYSTEEDAVRPDDEDLQYVHYSLWFSDVLFFISTVVVLRVDFMF